MCEHVTLRIHVLNLHSFNYKNLSGLEQEAVVNKKPPAF